MNNIFSKSFVGEHRHDDSEHFPVQKEKHDHHPPRHAPDGGSECVYWEYSREHEPASGASGCGSGILPDYQPERHKGVGTCDRGEPDPEDGRFRLHKGRGLYHPDDGRHRGV